ncbi:Hypothetical Protein FCC1311_090132 [Hondaea fermentalgiana]|uniref:Uncharacterized protein n=1 Tax=Hondaea fermentalgiana TaxID=2315210 RepID=A0A2R5GSQ4_9STRA|nr:Hypothetical Protein FCC1311_090132 [Hondaea fermentalgiana]|eukprot:GBG32788.1 Hypothetical Protein FCC1311_090132 [Hondaea fermentalgiana]
MLALLLATLLAAAVGERADQFFAVDPVRELCLYAKDESSLGLATCEFDSRFYFVLGESQEAAELLTSGIAYSVSNGNAISEGLGLVQDNTDAPQWYTQADVFARRTAQGTENTFLLTTGHEDEAWSLKFREYPDTSPTEALADYLQSLPGRGYLTRVAIGDFTIPPTLSPAQAPDVDNSCATPQECDRLIIKDDFLQKCLALKDTASSELVLQFVECGSGSNYARGFQYWKAVQSGTGRRIYNHRFDSAALSFKDSKLRIAYDSSTTPVTFRSDTRLLSYFNVNNHQYAFTSGGDRSSPVADLMRVSTDGAVHSYEWALSEHPDRGFWALSDEWLTSAPTMRPTTRYPTSFPTTPPVPTEPPTPEPTTAEPTFGPTAEPTERPTLPPALKPTVPESEGEDIEEDSNLVAILAGSGGGLAALMCLMCCCSSGSKSSEHPED